jgi:hypothetical protein
MTTLTDELFDVANTTGPELDGFNIPDPSPAPEETAAGADRARIVARHPAGQVIADWVTVPYPLGRARVSGLTGDDPVEFVDMTGRRRPAFLRSIRGNQTAFFDVLGTFDDQGEMSGDLFVAARPHGWSRFTAHPHVVGMLGEAPNVPGGDLCWTEELAETPAVKRTLYCFEVRASGMFVYVERIAQTMHPVVTWNVSRVLRRTDAGTGAGLRVGFPQCRQPVMQPESRWDLLGHYNQHLHLGLADEWGTHPVVTVQTLHDSRERLSDPITMELEGSADLGRPRARYEAWGEESADRWGVFGQAPGCDGVVEEWFRDRLAKFDSALHRYEEPRPFAQALVSGQAGAQRFGVSMGGAFLTADPRVSHRALRLAAEDELLRPVHWVDRDGRFLRMTDRPTLVTLDRRPFDAHIRDTAWLDEFGPYPPQRTPVGGRTGDDPEHVDDLALASYLALHDDCWAIEMCYRQIVEREAGATRLRAGWMPQTRGVGRSMLSLAQAAWLCAGDHTGETAKDVLTAKLIILREDWEGGRVIREHPERPVRPVRTIGPDPRALGGRHRVFVPYEHGTVVAGLVAAAHVLSGDQRIESLLFASVIADTVLLLAIEEGGEVWFPYCVGVPYDRDGATGLLPPAGWDNPESPVHMEWVAGDADSGWSRWTGRVAYLRLWLDEALSRITQQQWRSPWSERASMLVDQLDAPEFAGLSPDQRAEHYRMTALSTSLDVAPLSAPAVGPLP